MAKEMVGVHGVPHVKVNNPHLNNYTVFIQSGGGGSRMLKKDSCVLYRLNN